MKHLVAIALSASVALFSGIFSAQTLLAQDFAVNVGRELCDDAEVGETPDVSSNDDSDRSEEFSLNEDE